MPLLWNQVVRRTPVMVTATFAGELPDAKHVDMPEHPAGWSVRRCELLGVVVMPMPVALLLERPVLLQWLVVPLQWQCRHHQ